MSCTEIYGFDKSGNAYYYEEVKNAWRGAMAVWQELEKKYLPPYYSKYAHIETSRCTSFDEEAMKEIWNLAEQPNVSMHDKICLCTTFDKILVKKDDIFKVVEAFRNFEGDTSLSEQADILEEMYKDDDCIAVGWNQTSINCDTWENYKYNEEKDEREPYNCINDKEHEWLFDIESIKG